jgi:hypothetical protein
MAPSVILQHWSALSSLVKKNIHFIVSANVSTVDILKLNII